jgi:hypothetical protein
MALSICNDMAKVIRGMISFWGPGYEHALSNPFIRFMSRNLYFFSRRIFKCFRGTCLSKPARTMPEDNSKFDTLEQDNASRGHLSGEGKWGNTSQLQEVFQTIGSS